MLRTPMGSGCSLVRPARLSDDFVGTMPVIAHATEWYEKQGRAISAVCCLYATAPFVIPSDLKKGLLLLEKSPDSRFVFTATEYAYPIQRALRIDLACGLVRMFQEEYFLQRSQDLEPAYHDAGQFYWGRPQAWLQSANLFEGSQALLLPRWRVQDIDTEDDWTQAELMRRALP